jgi:hypothetical protein
MDIQEAAREALVIRDDLTRHCLSDIKGTALRMSFSEFALEMCEVVVARMPRLLGRAEIVIWTQEMLNTAVRGANEAFAGATPPVSLFDGIAERPLTQLWYVADGGFGLHDYDNWMQLPKDSKSDTLLVFSHAKNGAPTIGGVFDYRIEGRAIPYLRPVALLRPNEQLKGGDLCLLTGLLFMRLQLATKEPVQLPRPDRRRLQREGKPVPEINIIHLRRREPSDWHTNAEREYHHRWIVKGHWRRLNQPRKKDGARVTFVDSYVKGPEDKPLLPPRETVFAVTR